MNRLGSRCAALALVVLSLCGCGGGIEEGIPRGASQGLTPEQEKHHKELMADEAAQSKARRGPGKAP